MNRKIRTDNNYTGKKIYFILLHCIETTNWPEFGTLYSKASYIAFKVYIFSLC